MCVAELVVHLPGIVLIKVSAEGDVPRAADWVLHPFRADRPEFVSETKVNVVEEPGGVRTVVPRSDGECSQFEERHHRQRYHGCDRVLLLPNDQRISTGSELHGEGDRAEDLQDFSPSSQSFTWKSMAVSLNNFVLN